MDFLTGEIICIDKPLRWTSFDAVKRVRGVLTRRYGRKKFKVGHAGTLDPLATGVMVVCTGKATKRIEELQSGEKEYLAEIKLGATTPSFDLETPIDAHYPVSHITRELVEQVLKKFTGRIEQIPPSFSAVKIDGKRAYKLARQGKTVELAPKVLVIETMQLLDYKVRDSITVRIVCSKGTYIRALARDIGEALGTGAHLTGLRRTRVGNVTEADCMTVDQAVEFLNNVPIELPADDETIASNKNKEQKKQKEII